MAAALLTGRGGGPDVVSRALAAVSGGPYLGIAVAPDHAGRWTLVHIDTHATERVVIRTELWFDTRKHGISASFGGCSRIAGPVTHSGCISSVFASGDPLAITGSIDGYRAALASGRAQRANDAVVRGRQASWLRFTRPGYRLPKGWALYVAVDRRPATRSRIETRHGKRVSGGQDIDVIARRSKPPRLRPSPADDAHATRDRAGKKHPRVSAVVTLAQAARIVPGAVWPGHSAAGQPFRRARVITLDDGNKQLELLYGGACPARCILVKQGIEAGWARGSRVYAALPDQTIFVAGGRYGNGRAGRIKIRLEGTSKAAILATARSLRPLAS